MKILKTGFPFTFQEFRRLERLSQSFEKISNKNINKIQEISDIGINSLSFADLSIIQFHSNKKISKKAAKLALQINLQLKNDVVQEIQLKNWRIHYFQVFFLASSDFKSYFQALKVIRKNFADYEPYLIGLLFHEESVLGLNGSRVLHKYCIKNYPTSNSLDIICSLSHEIKKQWFGYLYQHNTQFLQDKSSWDKREEFILKIGALGFPEGVNILKQYQNDSDFNCRTAVARALRNILSKSSIKLLYLLLFDQEPSVHSEAVKSLSILFP
ncbi:MAG: HEAT repeat domain-containing protein, partial [Promethearchaeota archaeon]